MKLRKLRVCGFKSFADKTEFDFLDGITVVVGPNGCGKSNVVDAVKWTLGEQSAKSLRGKEMLDVIFNGAVGRKAAAFAETALVFENTAGLLGTEHKMVEVSRRLYRSGESEYLVNKNAARLKDIKELFMGTGVGVDAYSVIEQGKVDILLAANPQERRLIFEEAAGISRYKAKKKEALRKLEKVQANLGRLADINEEVEKRLRSLKLQAGKARNYQEYATRLKELRVRWSLAEYHTRNAERTVARQRLEEARARRAAVAAEHETAESARAVLADQLTEFDRTLNALRVEAADGQARIVSAEDRIAAGRRRCDELSEETARDRGALADGLLSCRDLLRRAENEQDELAALDARVAARQAELAAAQAETITRRAAAVQLAARIEGGKADVVEWVRRLSHVNNELAGIAVHQKNLQANRHKLQGRAETLRTEIDSLQRERDGLTSAVSELSDFIARQDQDRLERRAEAESLASRQATLSTELDTARRELGRLESRQAVLRELEAQLEGVDAGVREVLRRAKVGAETPVGPDDSGTFGSVRGMMADFLRASGQYVPVIEAALGRHLQSLVASRSDRLMSDIGASATLQGQAHFFCLDRLPESSDGLRLDGEPEYVGRPLDFVEVAPEVRAVAEHLFARTIVVRSVRGAMTLAPKVPRGYRFVTLDGQVVGEDGSLELGGPAGRGGLLRRKSELRELETQVAGLRSQVGELTGLYAEQGESARELDRMQQELRSAIYQAATTRAERQAQLERAEITLSKLAGEEPGLMAELAGLESDLAQVTRQVEDLRRAVTELDESRARAETDVAGLAAEMEGAQRGDAELAERTGDLRVEVSRAQQQRQSFAEQSAQLSAARRQAEESLAAARTRIERNRERLTEAERGVLSAEAERSMLYYRRDEAQREARQRLGGRTGLPERLAAATAAAKRLTPELADLTEKAHKLELACSEADVRVENLSTRVRDDYGLDLTAEYERLLSGPEAGSREQGAGGDSADAQELGGDAQRSAAEQAAPGDGPQPELPFGESSAPDMPISADETLQPSPEPVAADLGMPHDVAEPPAPDPAILEQERAAARERAVAELESGDWTAVQAEITELKGKIDRLGNVNIDSIAELADLEGRSGKLQSQVTDLNDARKQLEELIARINTESAVLFSNTFVEVRKNFQELFRKLFGGGKADVFLEDENNPLECGIDIIARPPGKEPRNISLLSGGEKTMTAVAMLLSVFRSRPSPFCILDEVDAALDEANTHRLGGVLTEFCDRSQFIVISHRKPTMSVANTMYGVTMQETGVSKKVAVRFNNHGQVIASDGEGSEMEMRLDG